MKFQLPPRANLEHLKKQAKGLLRQARNGESLRKTGLTKASKLSDAQFYLAKEYGFSSWSAMKNEIEGLRQKHLKQAISDLRSGKMCILFDDEGRENEGDFVLAAEKVDQEKLNFLSTYGRGTICIAISPVRARRLGIEKAKKSLDSIDIPSFGNSIDLNSTHTGVSAKEKAETILHLMSDEAKKVDFRSPGHVFTLIGESEGLTKRQGHTEGSLELMKKAGLSDGVVICEIMNTDGSMARYDDLVQIAKIHGIELIKISDLIDNN
ncbi:MAG: 3,4-dihydroxy-2-butanone-4-phosphate synthase [Bdellovibrionota bacterium]